MTRPVDPEGRAARFISLEVHESTHDRLVWGIRQNRDKAVAGVPEWEKLRELASQIKEHTLTHLDHFLEQFEANATRLGTHVHWARDAEEHNAVVYDILNAHRVKALIKSKSMLQEECGMTPYLQKRGIEVTESDLGERIQQLSHEPLLTTGPGCAKPYGPSFRAVLRGAWRVSDQRGTATDSH